jgi:hypothetical protein
MKKIILSLIVAAAPILAWGQEISTKPGETIEVEVSRGHLDPKTLAVVESTAESSTPTNDIMAQRWLSIVNVSDHWGNTTRRRVYSKDKKRDIVIQYNGDPTFPIEVFINPSNCPKPANCFGGSKVFMEDGAETNLSKKKLHFPEAIFCDSEKTVEFEAEVVIRDLVGDGEKPEIISFTCYSHVEFGSLQMVVRAVGGKEAPARIVVSYENGGADLVAAESISGTIVDLPVEIASEPEEWQVEFAPQYAAAIQSYSENGKLVNVLNSQATFYPLIVPGHMSRVEVDLGVLRVRGTDQRGNEMELDVDIVGQKTSSREQFTTPFNVALLPGHYSLSYENNLGHFGPEVLCGEPPEMRDVQIEVSEGDDQLVEEIFVTDNWGIVELSATSDSPFMYVEFFRNGSEECDSLSLIESDFFEYISGTYNTGKIIKLFPGNYILKYEVKTDDNFHEIKFIKYYKLHMQKGKTVSLDLNAEEP